MVENPDILFLGGLFPKEKENEILKNSTRNIQNAANVFQWNIVEGLDSNLDKPITILNSLYIGSFPLRYKRVIIKSYKFEHKDNASDYNAGFINLMGVKNLFRWISIKPYLNKWAISNKNNKVLITYALLPNNLKAIQYVKRINKNINTCIIVPDLPNYMGIPNNKNILYKINKYLEIKYIEKNIRKADSYILLTKHMKDKLDIENKPYKIIEGISTYTSEEVKDKNEYEYGNKVIVYTGGLHERYGILLLIEAFKMIEGAEYKLIICGDGDSRDKIKKHAQQDNRIEYKGTISRTEVLKIQSKATVLVNPRQNKEEYTKYSFPSKIIEYMSSGKPVICYKLDGIPREYDNYLIYVKGNEINDLKEKIIEVCSYSEREREYIGLKNKDFIISSKNGKVQAKKIIDMLKEIN